MPQVSISDEELLDEIRRLSDGGETPKREEMMNEGAHSPSTYRSRFGSWNEAVEAAGFEPREDGRPKASLPDEEMIAEIRRLADNGIAPTRATMREEGAISPDICCRRWGSWTEAVEAADLHPARSGPAQLIRAAQGGD